MRRLIVVAAVAAILGAIVLGWTMRPRLPAAERGRRLAEQTGCFGCHGPEGTRGTANPGRSDRTVPTYTGDVMMYADSAELIREWIRDGVTAKRAASQTWREQRDKGTLRMPAFKHRLSAPQIEDLVAFVTVMSEPEPADPVAARGQRRAEALGCFGCHGPGGGLARPNPGSLKGYVPSWDGADFPELVKDRAEFGQWVEHGVSERFDKNPLARFFLRRAVLKMPAFERHLGPADVDTLWRYLQWSRTPGHAVNRGGAEEGGE
jgi:mono/diheme cytochrome c family protein